mmetsp:Transcript_105322/g.250716  ORF Transcript_105322/g.250716 Transcript_105322/m.250716 type:complete len:303 (+) Transcript_105322:167-1075(+)
MGLIQPLHRLRILLIGRELGQRRQRRCRGRSFGQVLRRQRQVRRGGAALRLHGQQAVHQWRQSSKTLQLCQASSLQHLPSGARLTEDFHAALQHGIIRSSVGFAPLFGQAHRLIDTSGPAQDLQHSDTNTPYVDWQGVVPLVLENFWGYEGNCAAALLALTLLQYKGQMKSRELQSQQVRGLVEVEVLRFDVTVAHARAQVQVRHSTEDLLKNLGRLEKGQRPSTPAHQALVQTAGARILHAHDDVARRVVDLEKPLDVGMLPLVAAHHPKRIYHSLQHHHPSHIPDALFVHQEGTLAGAAH